jgi:ribose transport system permease protein
MSAATAVTRPVRPRSGRLLRRHGWTGGVWLLLAALVAWYAVLIPRFGGFETSTILRSGLPLAYLALAQGAIVLSGGIDLSLGSMMVLTNVVSARFMEGQSLGVALAIAVVVVAGALLLDALVGWVITVSRIPDIVVTLATSFVLGGLALWVLPSPGGGAPAGFRIAFTGSEFGIGTNPWPSLVALLVPLAVVWWILRRTRTGLALYAVGSNRDAAFLSGVNVQRARIVAYALGGALAALAGLATTAITGGGEPRFAIGQNATLNSVAAVVLGGIALTGGVGSPLGAVAAGYALFLLAPIMTALQVDPNQAQVVQGVLIILVVLVGGLWQLRRRAEA